MQSRDRDRRKTPDGTAAHHRPSREPDSARRVTLTIALAVTFVFLLVTAAGLGWFLSGNGPPSSSSDGEAASGGQGTAQEDPGVQDTGGRSTPGEDMVDDPVSGLSYRLPGEEWQRLGDDEVPAEYSSYTVYGSPTDPDAFIVTGHRDLLAVEPLPVAGARLALDALGDMVSDIGSLRLGTSGPTEVDGSPAFGAAVEGEEEGTYGRFLLVERGDRRGAFMLGLNMNGGEAVSTAIDEAFDGLRLP